MSEVHDESILHQADVEDVIDDEVEGGVGHDNAAITNLPLITGGESPTEAEHNAVITRLNLITQYLRNNGIVLP